MAGYSRIYCVGESGFDGVNPILFQILVGDADRQWLEVHYFSKGIKPLAGITRIIPSSPDAANALLDACIVFYPEYFSECPAISSISAQLQAEECLDFHLGKDRIPRDWEKLRSEAKAVFSKLHIWRAMLKQMQ